MKEGKLLKDKNKMLKDTLLKQFEFTANVLAPKAIIENISDIAIVKEVANEILIQINTFVWSEELEHVDYPVRISIPKTWWDFFKIQFFPKVLLEKYPPEFVEKLVKIIKIKKVALYPKLRAILQNDGVSDYAIKILIEEESHSLN